MNPLAEILENAAKARRDKIAIIDRTEEHRRTATYGELRAAARRIGGHLRELGLRTQDRVLFSAANGIDFPAVFFGVLYGGGTLVPTPVLAAERDIGFRLRHADCAFAIVDADREATTRAAIAASGSHAKLVRVEELNTSTATGLDGPVDVGAGAQGMILYTSGTTGKPKGAAITQETLVDHTRVIGVDALGLDEDDRILGVLPFTHSYGCRTAMLTAFLIGGTCVLPPRFDAAESLAIAAEEGVTFIPAVPTMFARWGVLPVDTAKPERLRLALAAGAPLADEIVHRAEARLGAEIRQAYGMTEATLATINAPSDSRVLGSVGRAAPDCAIRIVDEADVEQPEGIRGQILVRGGGVMQGYLDDETATAEALRGGWMHTGDIGWLDEQGHLFVVDRIKDMIIRGGNNIYPAEIEAVLNELPWVASVAVVGRPHPVHGEEIVAIIETISDAPFDLAELKAHAASAIARNKRPREWAVVEAMPLGPSAKILKRDLRHQIAAGLLALQS
ncbi:MAG: class I adenylate-forming enzyme family protein [Deltaproteobacteria bacterium]